MDPQLTGTLHVLFLYDVCEQIRLDTLRKQPGLSTQEETRERRRDPTSQHPSPEYVRFERSPVVQNLGAVAFRNDDRFTAEINYYDYGVVSLKLELPFRLTWEELVALSGKWVAEPATELEALQLVHSHIQQAKPAMIRVKDDWPAEDYYIVHLHNRSTPGEGPQFTANQLLAERGSDIARIVRGEVAALSSQEQTEILSSQMSYYSEDLLVVGWTAAFLCDNPEAADSTIQLLEYANTQLLELRYYDSLLTQVLERGYDSLDRRGGLLRRWRLAKEAASLNKIRLEVRELTERIDASIKFLSDMFFARAYRTAAGKIGVNDYRRLVDGKLETAGDLYTFLMDQFHTARAFVLELMVVIILVIELVFIFRDELWR